MIPGFFFGKMGLAAVCWKEGCERDIDSGLMIWPGGVCSWRKGDDTRP